MRARLPLAAAVSVLLLVSASAVAQLSDQHKEQLKEFEKYIRSDNVDTRVSQVEQLGLIDGPEAARLLLDHGLTDESPRVRIRATIALARKIGDAARDVIREVGLHHEVANVRAGAARALGRMPGDAAVPDLAALIARERRPVVLVAALEALGAHQTEQGVGKALELTRHRDRGVAIAAIEMVGATEKSKHAAKLHPLLNHKAWQIQAATLKALGQLRHKSSVAAVLKFFAEVRGRLRGDARDCLIAITQRQFGYDPARWQEWWDRSGETWVVPEKVEKKPEVEDKYGRDENKGPTYHKIRTESRKVLFVFDVSSSMNDPIRYRPTQRTRAGQSWRTSTRIELAKEELIRVLDTLDDKTWFNIVAFESIVKPYKPKLVRATRGSIGAAKRWVKRLKAYEKPSNGNREYTKEGYVRGKTNTFAALKWIYGYKRPGLDFTGRVRPEADTIFLMSDGRPSCGELTVVEEILEQVRLFNGSAKVVIHTIAYDLVSIGRKFLVDVARITDGQFVEIGAAR